MSKCRVCNERDAVAGYRGKCRHCNNLYQRQWREKNRDKCREYAKRRYEKAKKRGIIDNSQYPSQRVPNYKRGTVEVCRALSKYGLSSVKACEVCGKMGCERHEEEGCDEVWLCRSCHVKRHVR